MKKVTVLGSPRSRRVATAAKVEAAALAPGALVTFEKVTDYAAIVTYGVASTPGAVINGKDRSIRTRLAASSVLSAAAATIAVIAPFTPVDSSNIEPTKGAAA